MPLTLPPLNALRAFEAAARTGGFVAAADELGVTPAAISQHIRKLEDFFGKDLFLRRNNRVTLTDAGQSILSGTAGALQQISQTTLDLMSDRPRNRLVISCIESVAEKWLLPRLAAFSRLHPDFRFDLRVEADPVDFSRHTIDLRLTYGLGIYPDQRTQVLLLDAVQPMCSPDYLHRLGPDGMAAVPGADLLVTDWGASFASNPTWQGWFQRAGLPPPDLNGFQVGRSSLVIDMARQGLGVALAQRMLAADDLASGALVALSPLTIPLGHPYALINPHAKSDKRSLRALLAWLTRDA